MCDETLKYHTLIQIYKIKICETPTLLFLKNVLFDYLLRITDQLAYVCKTNLSPLAWYVVLSSAVPSGREAVRLRVLPTKLLLVVAGAERVL